MSEHRNLLAIASEGLSAEIDPLGAELHALRDAQGRDLQWNGDPSIWAGRAPILFPIVGMLAGGQYRLNGRSYHLDKHGFARRKRFDIVSAEASSAVLRLRADAETLVSYPFHFELDISFAIGEATLTLGAAVRNAGDAAMPASFGFHPAFRWPLPFGRPRSDHAIHFAEPEPAPIRRMDHRGLLRPEGQPTPVVGETLYLRDDLFQSDALMLDQIRSRSLRYGAGDGPSLTIDFPHMPYLGLWTKPGADFIAIEPWRGINDAEGFDGDIWEKPGIFAVGPGETRRLSMSVTLNP